MGVSVFLWNLTEKIELRKREWGLSCYKMQFDYMLFPGINDLCEILNYNV